MPGNFIDLLVVGYVGAGIIRGRRRGFAAEAPRLLSITLALVAGGGIFRWSERLLTQADRWAGQTAGVFGSGLILVGAFFLGRHFRARLRTWAAQRYPETRFQQQAGAIAGGLRTFAISALVIVLVSFLPLGFLGRPLTSGSLFGRVVIKIVRPLYALSHHKPSP